MPDSHAHASASPYGEAQGFAVKMMELLVVPTFVLDVQGKLMIWNRACEQLTGVPAAEVLGTRQPGRCFYSDQRATLADLLLAGHGGDARALLEQQQYRGSTGDNLCAENWCDMPRTGRRRYLAVDASPIYGNSGELIAVVETLRDMTDEKRAQVALERLAAARRCYGLCGSGHHGALPYCQQRREQPHLDFGGGSHVVAGRSLDISGDQSGTHSHRHARHRAMADGLSGRPQF